MPDKKITFPQISAGASSGLLVGILVGLSLSPIVGSLIAIFVPVSIAWIKMHYEKKGKTYEHDYSIRIAIFASFVILGVIVGIWWRTHNTLGISFKEELRIKHEAWKSIGFKDEPARLIVATNYLNLKNQGAHTGKSLFSTGLFTSSSDRNDSLKFLNPSIYENTKEALIAYKSNGGSSEVIADAIANLPEDQQKKIIYAIWTLLQ